VAGLRVSNRLIGDEISLHSRKHGLKRTVDGLNRQGTSWLLRQYKLGYRQIQACILLRLTGNKQFKPDLMRFKLLIVALPAAI